MRVEPRPILRFIALRRAHDFAAALFVPVILIGALGAAVPALQAQLAGSAATIGSHDAAPPPKTETPPPAESHVDSPAIILTRIANSRVHERTLAIFARNGLLEISQKNQSIADPQSSTPERTI